MFFDTLQAAGRLCLQAVEDCRQARQCTNLGCNSVQTAHTTDVGESLTPNCSSRERFASLSIGLPPINVTSANILLLARFLMGQIVSDAADQWCEEGNDQANLGGAAASAPSRTPVLSCLLPERAEASSFSFASRCRQNCSSCRSAQSLLLIVSLKQYSQLKQVPLHLRVIVSSRTGQELHGHSGHS